MSPYEEGMQFQRRVRANLTRDGYFVCQAGASKGVADLVATKIGQTLFVQVKLSNPQLSPAYRTKLYAIATQFGALPIVAWRTKLRGPIGFRELTGAGPNDHRPWTPDEVGRQPARQEN